MRAAALMSPVRPHQSRFAGQLLPPAGEAGVQAAALALALLAATSAAAQVAPYVVERGAIEAPLLGLVGDAARGRAIVANRQKGLCLLCHSGPIPEERFQGDLAPSLAGAGSRSTEGQIRLRMVDSRRVNPESVMPAYHAVDGLQRVGAAFAGKPVLSAQEIEDVVAYLKELKE
jgi:L-cysteine S-thiosulfotransferase